MPKSEPMLSVAEVCELQPGDEQNATWINPGFTAVVRSITKKAKKAGGFFYPCVLADTTGSATIEVSFFQAPKFSEGDQIEVSGSGLRRTEYQGKAQAAVGKSTEVHVLGKSVHHQEQVERAEALEPAVNGAKPKVFGATAGMAVKEAIALASINMPAFGPENPDFWARVHRYASAVVRLSNALEHGNLTPPLSKLPQPAQEGPAPAQQPAQAPVQPQGGRSDTPPKVGKPQPGPDGAAFPKTKPGEDEDVPF